jgi:hypothetical protein
LLQFACHEPHCARGVNSFRPIDTAADSPLPPPRTDRGVVGRVLEVGVGTGTRR